MFMCIWNFLQPPIPSQVVYRKPYLSQLFSPPQQYPGIFIVCYPLHQLDLGYTSGPVVLNLWATTPFRIRQPLENTDLYIVICNSSKIICTHVPQGESYSQWALARFNDESHRRYRFHGRCHADSTVTILWGCKETTSDFCWTFQNHWLSLWPT